MTYVPDIPPLLESAMQNTRVVIRFKINSGYSTPPAHRYRLLLLPPHASEQDNVIGLSIYVIVIIPWL